MHPDFHERKRERTEAFFLYRYGRRLHRCTACNGSGHYDSHRSPKCDSCNGTGKSRYDAAFPLFLGGPNPSPVLIEKTMNARLDTVTSFRLGCVLLSDCPAATLQAAAAAPVTAYEPKEFRPQLAEALREKQIDALDDEDIQKDIDALKGDSN